MEDVNFDEVLTRLGTGKWNLFYYVALAYWYSLVAYHTLGGSFFAPLVDYTCRVPAHAITPTVILPSNSTGIVPTNNTTYDPDEPDLSKHVTCNFQVEDIATGTLKEEPCTEWDFDNSTFTSTFTSEFSLACEYEYLRSTYQSIYMFGILIGAGINGFLADRFGRKRMVLVGSSIYSVVAIVSCWLPNVGTILAGRFFLGTMHPTSLQTGYILTIEVTEPRKRTAVGFLQFLSWPMALMLYAGFAFAVRDWRWLQFMVSLPCLLFLPCIWKLDESPRWLIVRGRHEEALAVLHKAARWNKASLPPDESLQAMMKDVQKLAALETSATEETLMAKFVNILKGTTVLFRTPKLRMITLVLYVEYFVVAMVYFGLAMSADILSANPFIYMAVSGVTEIPANTILIPIVQYFGKKYPLIVSYFICGLCMLLQLAIPKAQQWLVITIVMIGKLAITMVFAIIFLYGTELLPTEVRTWGLGTAMMSSRLGAMVSPYLMGFFGKAYPWSTPVVFGMASIIAGIAPLPLHDTKNTVLPDTIGDLENRDFKRTVTTSSVEMK